jgi:hypothetical protein
MLLLKGKRTGRIPLLQRFRRGHGDERRNISRESAETNQSFPLPCRPLQPLKPAAQAEDAASRSPQSAGATAQGFRRCDMNEARGRQAGNASGKLLLLQAERMPPCGALARTPSILFQLIVKSA